MSTWAVLDHLGPKHMLHALDDHDETHWLMLNPQANQKTQCSRARYR